MKGNGRVLILYTIQLCWTGTALAFNVNNKIWKWKCDLENEACVRVPITTNLNQTEYPSLEVCRLICGTNGALWPAPKTIHEKGMDLYQFSASSIEFRIAATGREAYEYLEEVTDLFLENLSLQDSSSCPESTNQVVVKIFVSSADLTLNWTTNEAYSLEITDQEYKVVAINSETVFGARHALETVTQLIDFYPNADGSICLALVSQAQITDAPAYPHRGLTLDTARNFQSIKTIKTHINAMAASKLNVLHWHITDTQSFPLEIPSLPNMTKFGAYSENKTYHPKEIQELLHYAKVRGVRIVIEIDAPAHAGNGWQWGPDAGLGNLAVCINQQPWRSFCIQPPCGQLNPANSKVYEILKTMYKDIVDMLPNGEVFHMGGDEVYIPCWNSTQEILDYIGNKPRTTETFLDLWSEFQNKNLEAFDSVIGDSSIPIILWTSHLTQTDVIEKYLSKNRYVIQTWVPASDPLPTDLLALGYNLIMSTKDAWYLDHGFWGTTIYHDWKVVYNNKIPRNVRVLGGEVCMWGEHVDDSCVQSRTWPRAAAAAERLWTDPDTSANNAATRFYRHRERLVSRGIYAESLVPRWCLQNEGEC